MKNLKIKNKILFPVLCLMVLAALGNVAQYYGAAEMNKEATIMNDDLLPSIKTTLSMELDFSSYRRNQYAYILTTPEHEQNYSERIEKYREGVDNKAAEYRNLIPAEETEELAAFDQFMVAWNDYKALTPAIKQAKAAGDVAEASRLVFEVGLPKFDDTIAKIEKLVDINEAYAQKASDKADSLFLQNRIAAIIVMIMMLVVGMIMVITLVKNIAGPVQKVTNYMGILAAGDLTKDVPDRERTDEIGDMTAAIQIFKDNMLHAKELEAEQHMEETAKQKRQVKVDAAIRKFELAMSDIVKFVSSASTELQASAQSLSASAEETSKQSGAVAAASQQAAANVQTVASATEELSSSINEIASQVSRSSQVASQAVTDAQTAGKSVSELVEAAQKIGEVTQIISAIAEQTNLLALNATIEAARAGDAGKGFAVVASEVKNLANESTKATEEISSQISNIQQISQTSAAAIDTICRIIREMDEISGTISAAIQEQTSATQEISRNVTEAYTGTSEVTQNIGSVSDAANSTGSASHQVLSAADELSRQSETLKEEFDIFIKEMAAA